MALKQRAEQTVHSESLGWEEEDEEGLIQRFDIKMKYLTSVSHLSFSLQVSFSGLRPHLN